MVEPMGFRLTEKNLKRAGCDYWDDVEVVRWPCVEAFFAAHGDDELHLFTGQAMPSTDRTRFCCSGARAAGSIRQSSMPAPTVAGASPCARAPVPSTFPMPSP